MSKYDNMDLYKGNSYETKNKEDLTSLREEFKTKYAKGKGWDVNDLSEEQLNEIKSQKGYQCPGMICG